VFCINDIYHKLAKKIYLFIKLQLRISAKNELLKYQDEDYFPVIYVTDKIK